MNKLDKQSPLYYKYSTYLKDLYSDKVYKLPININVSCPNRDGTIDTTGCFFCSELGAGFESLDSSHTVKDQLTKNMDYIGKRYGANKFIAYFQNYTNTHLPVEQFKKYMIEACQEHIVELDISTRPDCISKAYLDVLKDISTQFSVNITIELGLQTTNDKTLKKVNRGHSVQDFVDAVQLINTYNFNVCTHLILNLPWDQEDEVVNMAHLMNTLQISQVKLHALYIAKNTIFANMYLNKEFTICSKEAYEERVILFLEHLNPHVAIQRLIGRAPKEETIFCNWDTSWWKIKDEIETKMNQKSTYQGRHYQEVIL